MFVLYPDSSNLSVTSVLKDSETLKTQILHDNKTDEDFFVNSYPINLFTSIEIKRFLKYLYQLHTYKSRNILSIDYFFHDDQYIHVYSKSKNLSALDIKNLSDETKAKIIHTVVNQTLLLHKQGIFHMNLKLSLLMQNSDGEIVIPQPRPNLLYDFEEEDQKLPFYEKDLLACDCYLVGLIIVELITGMTQTEILTKIWNFEKLESNNDPLLELGIQFLDFDVQERPKLCHTSKIFGEEGIKFNNKVFNFTFNETDNLPNAISDDEYLNIVRLAANKSDQIALLIFGSHLIMNGATAEEKQAGVCYSEMCKYPAAMNNLFNFFIKDNTQKAFEYLEKAADMEYPVAVRNVYLQLISNKLHDRNLEEIMEKLKNFGYKGYIPALYTLSSRVRLYDPAESYKMIVFCAQHGYSVAVHYAGLSYEYGFGVEKNIDINLKWWDIGLKMKYGPCANNLGTHSKDNNVLAVKYWKIGVELGCAEAEYNLATFYLKGRGVKKDEKEAFRLMKSAASKGMIFAMFDFALMVRDGIGCEKDEKLSEQLCQRASDARKMREMKKKSLQEVASTHGVTLPKYFDYF